MLTNIAPIESFFKEPSNIHKLYVYEIINFDNDVESIVSSNTNNFLKLKFHSEKNGVFESVSFSPQVKILSDANDMSLKINTDYSFLSNDDFSFLEQTRKTYVFTIMRPFSQGSLVYFIGENSMRTINNLDGSSININDSKYEESTLIYAITFQNIKKLEVGKNSTINFLLIEELPEIKRIESIDYVIPINSLYQTLQVIGDLKNDKLGLTLENEKIDLELSENNGFIPVNCRLTNCNVRAELEIMNFSLLKQLPLNCLNEIVNQHKPLETIFENFYDAAKEEHIIEIIKLLKKIILISYCFVKNFNWFDKNNESFINFFNTNFANKSMLEFNNNLIFDYENKYPNVINSQIYKIFQAACYSLSHRVVTPFGADKELSNDHKNKLWVYFEVNNSEEDFKRAFNKDGSFNDAELELFHPYVIVESSFFKISKGDAIFNLEPLNNVYCQLGDKLYLSNSTQNVIDGNYYQMFLFSENWSQAIEIMQNFSSSIKLVNKTKTVYIQKEINSINIEELKKLLPVDAEDIKQVGDINAEEVDGEVVYLACPLTAKGWCGRNVNLHETLSNKCRYYGIHGGSAPGAESHTEDFLTDRPYAYKKLWKFSVTFNFKSKESEFWDVFSFSAARIFDIIFNTTSNATTKLKFKLSDRLIQKGWYLAQIKYDLHYSFLNSANSMILNYTNMQDEKKIFAYENIKSFQKIDNKISLTKNQY